MSRAKRVYASPAVQNILCRLVVLYLRFVHATTRWQVINADIPRRLIEEERPGIGAAWHGRIALLAYAFAEPHTAHVLISRGRDGAFMSRIIERFGYRTVRGSARAKGKTKAKGGASALRAMVRIISSGGRVLITPDGPRGPRMRVSEGIITLARLTGVPIYPMSYGISRRRVIGSWDRFIFPLPFGRGVFIWGTPVMIARDADAQAQETARRTLEDELNRITRQADEALGQEKIEPAPLSDTA